MSPPALAHAKPVPLLPARPPVGVVVAMSPLERTHFLGPKTPRLAGADVTVFDCVGGPDELLALLTSVRPEVMVLGWAAPPLPRGFFDHPDCPVRYVCFATGSVRRVPRSFIERGGLVTNWGDGVAAIVAEHALLLLLASLRRMPDWPGHFGSPPSHPPVALLNLPTRSLHGRTVSIHGFGQIAREIVRVLAPFKVRVKAYSGGVSPDFIRTHDVEPTATLEELFDQAEILIECEALTPSTAGIVTGALLDRLAPQAVFVNVGRGAVVDEPALIERVTQGRLHVALDVFTHEPLPSNASVLRLPGAVVSPHIGGPTLDRLPELGQRALENVRRYLAGETPLHLVTPAIYDRST